MRYQINIFAVCLIGVILFFSCNSEAPPVSIEEIIESKPEKENPPAKYKPFVPIKLSDVQAEKVSSDNEFSFKIWREVSSMKGENTFFSPLSLNVALGMLYNGASSETRAEMAEILGLSDYDETENNEYYQKMMRDLSECDAFTTLDFANSIWYNKAFSVKQPFIDINKKYFDAYVQGIDFKSREAAVTINDWCAKKTNDRIKTIIEDPISSDMVMILINTLYFKSNWDNGFDPLKTKKASFTTSDKKSQEVKMMEQTSLFRYFANAELQCIEKPFGNSAFSMVFILPAIDKTLDQLFDHLNGKEWHNTIEKFKWTNVELKLPSFKIECDMPLKDPLTNVGMNSIFNGGFINITDDPCFVSQIKQKTFIEVNENGAEAAAATFNELVGESGVPLPPIPFIANRPFLYLIKEKSTGIILFIGRLDNPISK